MVEPSRKRLIIPGLERILSDKNQEKPERKIEGKDHNIFAEGACGHRREGVQSETEGATEGSDSSRTGVAELFLPFIQTTLHQNASNSRKITGVGTEKEMVEEKDGRTGWIAG